ERAKTAETMQFQDVSRRAIDNLRLDVDKVNWFSTYHVHHRVTDHFRRGRAFVLGDAAHIHSPAGGQGMNTGIGDAINLACRQAAYTLATGCHGSSSTGQIIMRRWSRRNGRCMSTARPTPGCAAGASSTSCRYTPSLGTANTPRAAWPRTRFICCGLTPTSPSP